MLKVILNRLKPQAEEIIAEEQAGFRSEEAPQSKSSTLESCVKSTSNISRICTMSSLISKKAFDRVWMEISVQKTNLMTNSAIGIQKEINVTGKKLGTATSFKYLGAVVSDDGSKPQVLSRIAQVTPALTKLKPIWRDNNISLGSKVKLMRSLVISIFLYSCESWSLTAELEKRTKVFEIRCYRRLLKVSYKDHGTSEEVRRKMQATI